MAGEAAGAFQQQQEEEAPEPPQHRVRPAPALRRAASPHSQPQHSSGRLARCCVPSSTVDSFFLIRP